MKTDADLARDVAAELRSTPNVDEADIAVKVHDGEVTLTGFVQTYYQKYGAEQAVKRVSGVAAIANDIDIHLGHVHGLDDPEIAQAAVAVIRAQRPALADSVQVLVHHGFVSLEGTLEWYSQKLRIEDAIRHVPGVTGVSNEIVVRPTIKVAE